MREKSSTVKPKICIITQVELHDILQTITNEKVVQIESCEDLIRTGVTNNKLYVLNKNKAVKYVLKVYFKDERKRLEREYAGYEFFDLLRSDYSPKPIYRNDTGYFALYSFLPGEHKSPSEATSDNMKAISDFLIYMHSNSLRANSLGIKLMPAIASCFSIQETVDKINMKLNKFMSDNNIEAYAPIRAFKSRFNIPELFSNLIKESLSELTKEQIETKLPPELQTVSPVDLNFTNILFEGPKAFFLDFEDFGWDDPINIFGFFLHHDKETGLSYENKKIFIKEYVRKTDLSKNFKLRLKTILRLGGLVWLGTYLLAMTEEKLRVRRFSNANFDVETYLKGRIERFESKLAEYQTSDINLPDLID